MIDAQAMFHREAAYEALAAANCILRALSTAVDASEASGVDVMAARACLVALRRQAIDVTTNVHAACNEVFQ